ncbi:hypothetical protein F5Y13DRAFT_198756 [Hypoxylon sp. FL1857]|nr:hypothetical protein F5Y13DRAFT_198756 [Hypoxylon sp. FL1857]
MSVGWIDISSRWELTSVQAALNVFVSILGTFGIWSASRFWWQRGSARILCNNTDVPLPTLYSISGLGDSWDAIFLLQKAVFTKDTWHLLIQLVVVVTLTLSSMFAGPIAKSSLRSIPQASEDELEVLYVVKGDGFSTNRLLANVMWNETIQSLDKADFPTDQLLDYLPSSSVPWIYKAEEWDPTWRMTCSFAPETVLHNVEAYGNYTFYDPVNAFPVFRETYDPSWFDSSKYRMQSGFDAWYIVTDEIPFKETLFFTLFQSDPEVNDRMYMNNDTLEISLSVLHAQGFKVNNFSDTGQAATTEWMPIGPVQNATFARTDCNITRKAVVKDENAIPWIWTNDTYSITMSYQNYYMNSFTTSASKGQLVATPTSRDLLRFYQAYLAAANTIYSSPTLKKVSVWKDVVQLSVALLVTIIILAIVTIWLGIRYFIFVRRHGSKLEEACIPDGKIEWMVHAARLSALRSEEEMVKGKRPKDREHFCGASFGYGDLGVRRNSLSAVLEMPRFARVHTRGTSISDPPPNSPQASFSTTLCGQGSSGFTPRSPRHGSEQGSPGSSVCSGLAGEAEVEVDGPSDNEEPRVSSPGHSRKSSVTQHSTRLQGEEVPSIGGARSAGDRAASSQVGPIPATEPESRPERLDD